METKLDIAVDRIIDMALPFSPNIDMVRLKKDIKWEIVTAVKEITMEEIMVYFTL